MALSNRLARDFSSLTRSRGHEYYRRGVVRIERGSATEVVARVSGSQVYSVRLKWDGEELLAWCDCPYFESAEYCKHLWATILAADTAGHLAAAGRATTFLPDYDGETLDDADFDDEDDLSSLPHSSVGRSSANAGRPPAPPPPPWQQRIAEIGDLQKASAQSPWPVGRTIAYLVDAPTSVSSGNLALRISFRDARPDGKFKEFRPPAYCQIPLAQVPEAVDREILALLTGGRQTYYYSAVENFPWSSGATCVGPALARVLLPRLLQTGRCYLAADPQLRQLTLLSWDEAGPWSFHWGISRSSRGDAWTLAGWLARGEERMELGAPVLLLPGGFVFTAERVAALEAGEAPFAWISQLRKSGPIEVPDADRERCFQALLAYPGMPSLQVPEELRFEEVAAAPRPCLRIRTSQTPHKKPPLRAQLSFDYSATYAGSVAGEKELSRGWYDADHRVFYCRDPFRENAARRQLIEVGFRPEPQSYWNPEPGWEIGAAKLPAVVRALAAAGWHIEAEGKVFRSPGAFHASVSSGIDWFELHGEVQYGEVTAKLPELLAALRRGENMVQLGNGEYGLLPEEWLSRFGPVAGMGVAEVDHIRFRTSQAGLLDALLAAQPQTAYDETFARARERLRSFQGIEAAPAPHGFSGRLRDYQREGLGWMLFLQRFSFGGCLADDMGVGKTAQVLALLEMRRELRARGEALPPSLVVVPRSLVFNWKQEAERFTPQLRVLDYTGSDRGENPMAEYDVTITTYGTLRRDVPRLSQVEFDYVVLDEAQAIKNAGTDSAKAVRLLRGRHRLALSGTPVENHLGELWSLFEFLNPGMLGASAVFKRSGGALRDPDEATRALLAQALRPFILRRTKEQVARELPAKTEQTIVCELEPAQRKLYDELRRHYREALLPRVDAKGIARTKIQVLEALLRLRQAACHPGLIDEHRRQQSSAKMEVLLEQLREVLEEGHKALVFSQFTSFLRLVRDRLEQDGIRYEYLDGQTTDRQRCVERFQNLPDCRLFLISLKAGGLGLNLTAAEYVFLLDPWWNPAVEAQAVDRAHRIGQERQVFAYRLIARDTVEEKVLELQKTKRALADAIIGEDNNLIRDLRREDLEVLLS